MPRQARIDGEGTLHHIICRGIERRDIFSDDRDRDDFVSRLGAILLETSTRCFACTLIPNHNSDFVEQILNAADEEMERKVRYSNQGLDLENLSKIVAGLLNVEPGDVEGPGKQPARVQARNLFCYWAVRELGATATSIAKYRGLSQPAVSQAVKRGESFTLDKGLRLAEIFRKPDVGSGRIL